MRARLPLALVVAALALVAGCGEGETLQPVPETVVGEVQQPTLPEGDPQAGEEVYASAGCGNCHTFEAAETESEVGPSLDESLEGEEAEPEFIRQSIVNPDAEIEEGFQPGVMPQDYGQQLEDQQLADLVAFIAENL